MWKIPRFPVSRKLIIQTEGRVTVRYCWNPAPILAKHAEGYGRDMEIIAASYGVGSGNALSNCV